MNQTTTEVSLADIEQSTKKFSIAHAELAAVVSELNADLEAIKRAGLASIKRALAKAAERQSELAELIENGRHLFIKPRTIVMHGVKVGLAKGKGGILFEDAQKVVAIIKKHFPDKKDLLIDTKETPDKEGLEQL